MRAVFLVTDLRTSLGTYVNGMRSAERWLSDRDQIGVGRTTLMFRSGDEAKEESVQDGTNDVKPVLLASCSLLFLFRALAASSASGQSNLLRNQILRLVSDLIPVEAGYLVLGSTLPVLAAQFEREWPEAGELERTGLARVAEEGAFEDKQTGIIGVPLYLANVLGGALLLRTKTSEREQLSAHLQDSDRHRFTCFHRL